MKFLKKLKSSNFWVSMISAVVLILQAVFNVDIKTEYLNQIIMAILGLLVMSGIVSDSSSDEVTVNQNVDVEKVDSLVAQVTSNLQANVQNIIKQFESITDSIINNLTASTHTQNSVEEEQGSIPTNNEIISAENEIKQDEAKVEPEISAVAQKVIETSKVSSENVL